MPHSAQSSSPALVVSACHALGDAFVKQIGGLCARQGGVVLAIDERTDDAELAPLALRWAHARQLFADMPRVWTTPLVSTPGLSSVADQCAALAVRVGRFDVLYSDSPALLRCAHQLGLQAEALPAATPRAPPAIAHDVTRALVVTRAQPFHRGHLALVERALALADEVVLVIAAAERSHSARDPFSAGERLAMVRAALAPWQERVWLAALPAPVWPALALEQLAFVAPPYQVVLGHNPLLRALAAQHGKRVEGLSELVRCDGDAISASRARARLVRDGVGAWLARWMPAESAAVLQASPELAQRCAVIASAEG
jgi:nicotinamide-nucleotide adenylyltransferase